jgi:uncharacterized membrane protein
MATVTVNHAGVEPQQNLVTITHVMYALHAFSTAVGILTPAFIVTAFLFGWPSIIAVIINYVKRDEVRGTYLESHFRWQLRTFWYALLWLFVAFVCAITVVGIPIAFVVGAATGIWLVYRIIRGWMALSQRRPMDLPR